MKSSSSVPRNVNGQSASPAVSAPDDVTCAPVMLDRVLEISRKRRAILSEMRTAIQRADKEAVFALAKKLTGLSDETGSGTNSRFN